MKLFAALTVLLLGAAVLLLLPVSCSAPAPVQDLTLATASAPQDTGLLDELLPEFRRRSGIAVKVEAVGSGQALELGRRGAADVLLVAAPEAEEAFMRERHGQARRRLMHNDLVLVGPPRDPADVRGSETLVEAFARIAQQQAPFVSRGGAAGTCQKERALWQQAGIATLGDWHSSTAAGMGETLRQADQKRAYALTDRGTFLTLKKDLDLHLLVDGEAALPNPYHVIVVHPDRIGPERAAAARQLADYLTSAEAQRRIAAFGAAAHGRPLFYPER